MYDQVLYMRDALAKVCVYVCMFICVYVFLPNIFTCMYTFDTHTCIYMCAYTRTTHINTYIIARKHDSFQQATYTRLFYWIVRVVNKSHTRT